MHVRSPIMAIAFIIISGPAWAAGLDGRGHADPITWAPVNSGDADRGAVLVTDAADRAKPSVHADAITWECPKSLALTN